MGNKIHVIIIQYPIHDLLPLSCSLPFPHSWFLCSFPERPFTNDVSQIRGFCHTPSSLFTVTTYQNYGLILGQPPPHLSPDMICACLPPTGLIAMRAADQPTGRGSSGCYTDALLFTIAMIMHVRDYLLVTSI